MSNPIALDTMVFIYYLEENAQFGAKAKKIFESIESSGKGITSVITISETLALPILSTKPFLYEKVKLTLKSINNMTYISVDEEVAEKAALLKRKYSLRLPDTLQLATAWNKNASQFITNDKKLKRVNEVTVTLLHDYIVK